MPTLTNPRPISPTGEANNRMRLRALCGIPQHHRITITQGIMAYPAEQQEEIIHRILVFQAFTEDNDPHLDRDLMVIEYLGTKIYGKMDHYDLAMEYLSPDTSNDQLTTRVLTIMLADEY